MKNWVKLCLCIGLVCVLLGAGAAAVGYAMGGGAVSLSLSGGMHVEVHPWGRQGKLIESSEQVSPFRMIDAALDCGDLTIAEGDEYRVSISRDERVNVDFSVQDGVLTLENPERFQLLLGTAGKCSVTVTVPRDTKLDRLNASTNLGCVTARDIQAEEMELSSDLGNVTAETVSAQKASLTTNMGQINAAGLHARELELKDDMGDMEITGVEITELLDFDSSMGSVCIDGRLANVSGDCDMGSILLRIDGLEDAYSFDLSCDMGTVKLNGEKMGTSYENHGNGRYTVTLDANMGDVEVTTQPAG